MHALPLAYNKDMQEDKEHLFDAVDTLEICLEAAAGMLRTATFNRDRLSSAAADEFLAATEIADLLVRRGVPFRESHGVVAGIVRHALETASGSRSSSWTSCTRFPTGSTTSITRCSPTTPGSSRRCPRAGPPRVAFAIRSKARARC